MNTIIVANFVAILLLSLSTARCNASAREAAAYSKTELSSAAQTNQTNYQVSSETEAERVEREKHPFTLAPERMSVEVPTHEVLLGNPLQLRLILAPGKLVGSVVVTQRNKYDVQAEDGGPVKVISINGDQETIEITPIQIGPVEVEIGVLYADNALVRQTIEINVAASQKNLKTFSLHAGSHSLVLRINDGRNEHGEWLHPVVSYNDLPHPIYLHNSEQIKLSVEQDPDDPVISVSDKGLVHAFREGRATITGDFDGVKDRIKVVVISPAIPRPK